MTKTVEAIYGNGVFKPLHEVQIKEHEKVEIKILSRDEWQNKFNRIIEKIHKKSSQYSTEEIETDITEAIKEVRARKRVY